MHSSPALLQRYRLNLLSVIAVLIGGCGGGGGSSGAGAVATLTVNPLSITVSANTADPAPSAPLTAQITTTSQSQTQFYLDGKFTTNGISTVTDPASNGDLQIQFKDPSTLGAGTYTDMITIEACKDQACTEQIAGSPQQIPVTYTVTVATPQISGFSPPYALVGAQTFTLVVNGQAFTTSSVVQWGVIPLATTFVSSTSLSAVVPASYLTAAANVPITVANGAAVSPSVTFGVDTVAPPILESINIGTADVNGPSFTITAYGNFQQPSTVQWAGTALATTFVNSGELTAVVPASDLTAVGQYAITVSSDGEISAPIEFTVQNVQTPTITQLSPASVTADGAPFLLTVTGTNLAQESVVNWNGSARTTSYISSTQLSAQITAADLVSAGAVPITVQTQTVVSLASDFQVNALPTPALGTVTPGSVAVGGPAFVLDVNGAGFTTSTSVQWNGSARTTNYVSTNLVRVQILKSDIAATGTASVTVSNPANLGGLIGTASVTVAPASIDAVSYQINPSHSGAVTFKSASLPAASLWSVNLGGAPSYALVASGLVYVVVVPTQSGQNQYSQLFALSQATGATVWGPIQVSGFASIAYENGKVFMLSNVFAGTGLLQAFNATTGNVLWSNTFSGAQFVSAGVVAANGMVYTTDNGALIGVSEATGATVWQQGIFVSGEGTPAVTADGVYLDYLSCQAYDFDPASGAAIWQTNNECFGGGGDTPVVANGEVFEPEGNPGSNIGGPVVNAETGVTTGSFTADYSPALGAVNGYFLTAGTLRGMQLSNSTTLWSFVGDGELTSAPILVNNYVFIASSAGNVYALDATTGAQLWTVNVGSNVGPGPEIDTSVPYNGLSAGDGLLIVPSQTTVTAYLLSSDP